MMKDFKTFERLTCWQACRELRRFVSRDVVALLPYKEKYRIGDQITQAARSATANIAEGYGRFHFLDKARFCCNARASAYEVLDHLITAADEGLISQSTYEKGMHLVEQSIRLLNGCLACLQRTARDPTVREEAGYYEVSVNYTCESAYDSDVRSI